MFHIKSDFDQSSGCQGEDSFESVNRQEWMAMAKEHWYTISSPCEPSAQVS